MAEMKSQKTPETIDMNGDANATATEAVEILDPSAIVISDPEDGKKTKVLSPANTYAAKKTVAQGMMDIALITANANQLRYILEFGEKNGVFYLLTSLIAFSLLLQVGVGVCLIFKGRFDMTGDSKHRQANRLNNYVVMGVFLVTIINVFVANFTISPNEKVGERGV